jgi:hypothetical protein
VPFHSLFHGIHTGSGALLASYTKGTEFSEETCITDIFSLLPGFSGKPNDESGCVWWLVSFEVNEKISGSAIVWLTGGN